MDGIINVYKEPGFTSHDVVAKLRGILHMKKIGHTGTLDPDAEGVLPVCIGRATKLCGMITDWGKTYEAVMLLGKKTDTQDISGNITEQREVCVDERMVLEAATSFVGGYEQLPPMYSALKHNGKKLYELARQGIEIERKPRRVEIDFIRINEMNLEDEEKTVTLTVSCSKGTYIRTLINDIGDKLGCGACMAKLIRTRVGRFEIDNSLTLNQISALIIKGTLQDYITPADELFEFPRLTVGGEYSRLLYNGNPLPAQAAACMTEDFGQSIQESADDCIQEEAGGFAPGQQYRIYDEKGEFIGVYVYEERRFVPVKIFYSGERDEM